MTLLELRERIDRLVFGGIASDETFLDDAYEYTLIHDTRASVLRQDFAKTRRWSPGAIQVYYPEYDVYYQDSLCYTRFQLPCGFIQATGAQDGLVFVGSSSTKILTSNNFRRVNNRNELSSFHNNEYTTPANGRYIAVLIEGLLMQIISKDRIKQPMITGVFSDPTSLPTFNIEKDEYPISQDLITTLEMNMVQTVLGIITSKIPDFISNTKIDASPLIPAKK